MKNHFPQSFCVFIRPVRKCADHGVGQEVLQTGKASVTVADLEPVGNYALKITFSDGHNSGLYDWAYLHKLAHNYDALWADYLRRMELAGASRIPSPDDLNAEPKSGHTCGSGGCGGDMTKRSSERFRRPLTDKCNIQQFNSTD